MQKKRKLATPVFQTAVVLSQKEQTWTAVETSAAAPAVKRPPKVRSALMLPLIA